MTVGIVLTNGLESIVITDSRESGLGRQSDSVNKMGEFSADQYRGAIYGAGSGNILESIIKNLSTFSGDSLDDFLAAIHQEFQRKGNDIDRLILQNGQAEIDKKASIITNNDERAAFISQSRSRLLNDYDKMREESRTTFAVVAYDKKRDKARIFAITRSLVSELYLDHNELGSGLDGANLHLVTHLQGLNIRQLSSFELAFFAVNAYSNSTINAGVGGTPKLLSVAKEGAAVLSVEKTVALTNLSGAYIARYQDGILSPSQVIAWFKEIFESQQPNYDVMSSAIDLNADTFTTTYIPLSSWVERSNKQLFPKK